MRENGRGVYVFWGTLEILSYVVIVDIIIREGVGNTTSQVLVPVWP